MKSKRRLEGYLVVDPGHGPSLSAEQIARDTGRTDVAGAGVRSVMESATITCAHCHRIVVLNPQRTRERGYCRRCDHYVCDDPVCNAFCSPMNATLDKLQAIAFGRQAPDPGAAFLLRSSPPKPTVITP